MLIYKSDNQTFEGIKSLSSGGFGIPEGATLLAQVWVEGEMDYWWLADWKATEELQRYYRMHDGREYPIRILRPLQVIPPQQ